MIILFNLHDSFFKMLLNEIFRRPTVYKQQQLEVFQIIKTKKKKI